MTTKAIIEMTASVGMVSRTLRTMYCSTFHLPGAALPPERRILVHPPLSAAAMPP
jgi:hypothetical protein